MSIKSLSNHSQIRFTAQKMKSEPINNELQSTLRVMKLVSPYFLSKYTNGSPLDVQKRQINGVWHIVERFNHGLAHGLRQGALAKDIVDLLAQTRIESGNPDINGFLNWVAQQQAEGPSFLAKLEMAASFQRTGRQKEFPSSANPELYKQYELQDAVNFKKAAILSKTFKNNSEIELFKEAILWSNRGVLNENDHPDLKYLRCIIHAAHTLDLRRIPVFNEAKIKKDALDQLFNGKADCLPSALLKKLTDQLWKRSGQYLKATGDRDLIGGRKLSDAFFIQTKNPMLMVEAIHQIRSEK